VINESSSSTTVASESMYVQDIKRLAVKRKGETKRLHLLSYLRRINLIGRPGNVLVADLLMFFRVVCRIATTKRNIKCSNTSAPWVSSMPRASKHPQKWKSSRTTFSRRRCQLDTGCSLKIRKSTQIASLVLRFPQHL